MPEQWHEEEPHQMVCWYASAAGNFIVPFFSKCGHCGSNAKITETDLADA